MHVTNVALFLVAAGWEVKVKQSYQVMKQEDKKKMVCMPRIHLVLPKNVKR